MWGGTYKQKAVIKLAPDAFIEINGKNYIEICPICRGKLNLSDYITTVQSSLSTNGTVGTASFSLAMPRHGHMGHYMIRGGRVFGLNLMDEISIYFKSRYPSSKDGNYLYYKSFWGIITNISEAYSDGIQTISVSCESILKWLQIMKTNEHPSLGVYSDPAFTTDITPALVTGKSYSDMNVYQIIYSLVNITYLNMVIPESLNTEQVRTANNEIRIIEPINPREIDLLKVWQDKFKSIKSSLRMFGTSPDSFIGPERPNKEKATNISDFDYITGSQNSVSPIAINWNSKAIMDFKPFSKAEEGKSMDIIQNTYKNNLEIINEVKIMSGYEFYLDTVGELIFKPPFWNLDVRTNPVYVIKDSDIFNWDFIESSEDILTRIMVTGSIAMQAIGPTTVVPRGCFTNYNLARQFGLVSNEINMRFFTNAKMCYYHAISELDRTNANRFKGSLTIIGRPELRLGMPIYIESRDCFGYISNISHNFSFGSTFTTQIEINAVRRKYIGEDPMSSSFKQLGNNSSVFGLKGESKVLLYKNDPEFAQKILELDENYKKLVKDGKLNPQTLNNLKIAEDFTDNNQYFISNRAGMYVEKSLLDKEVVAAMITAQKAKDSDNQDAYLKFLEKCIPVSDEEGYELIGVYENGRSLYLDQNNVIKKKGKSFSTILEQVLKNAGISGFVAPDISGVKPGDIAETKQDSSDQEPKKENEKTAKEIETFFNFQAKSLNELIPKLDKSTKGCSCFDPSLSGSLSSSASVTDSSKKTIAKSSGGIKNG